MLRRVWLCDPMDYSPTGSSVHRVFQARILEWVAFPTPGDLPNPGIKPRLLGLLPWQADSLPLVPTVSGRLPLEFFPAKCYISVLCSFFYSLFLYQTSENWSLKISSTGIFLSWDEHQRKLWAPWNCSKCYGIYALAWFSLLRWGEGVDFSFFLSFWGRKCSWLYQMFKEICDTTKCLMLISCSRKKITMTFKM